MRFNTVSQGIKVINKAGGQSYSQTPELELVSILLTSFANDQAYRSGSDTFLKLRELIERCDKLFVAKAAIYARTKYGMRSITHVVASELAKHISGETWGKDFYDKIVYRPDDMMEILSYHTLTNGKVPNSIKKGFAKAFERFDSYRLAKYRGEGKGFKLVDVVNLVHPVPVDKNKEALSQLISGELKSLGDNETWESVSSSKDRFSTNKEKWEYIIDMWIDKEGNVKNYFAILRNIRNVIEANVDEAKWRKILNAIINEKAINSSLVLPFRFITAFEEIQKLNEGKIIREALIALNVAVDISLSNVPKFDGDTLVVLDVSGSMAGKPAQIGSLFASVLIKSNNADFMVFADRAAYVNVNPMDTTITIANSIRFASGGTNFQDIFRVANKKYDRIVILSDMQGWIGHYTPKVEFDYWKNVTGANPFVYSFDLAGLGSMQFPEQNVFCLAGFSDKTVQLMSMLETDKKALINEINKIEL